MAPLPRAALADKALPPRRVIEVRVARDLLSRLLGSYLANCIQNHVEEAGHASAPHRVKSSPKIESSSEPPRFCESKQSISGLATADPDLRRFASRRGKKAPNRVTHVTAEEAKRMPLWRFFNLSCA